MPRVRRAQLALIGVVATALALGLEWSGVAPLDATAFARWHRAAPPSGGVIVVRGDAATVMADDAALARVVSRLSRAGAAAIVLDLPSRAPRGGAAGEALLRQAVAQAGNVVLAVAPGDHEGRLAARAVGHTVGRAAGGVATIPAFVTAGVRRVPPLGLAAATVALNAEASVDGNRVTIGARRIPLDSAGRMLVAPTEGLPTLDAAELSLMVSAPDIERLASLVNGKIVVLLGEAPQALAMRLQAELADAVLVGSMLGAAPAIPSWIVTLGLAVTAGWLWLALRWWAALAATLILVLIAIGAAALLLHVGVVGSLTAPLTALILASLGALGWRQLDARRRLGGLEAEVRTLREALARHESIVETLEEDLETARAAEQAGEALRAQLDEARRHETELRQRLEAIARESRAVVATATADEASARVGIVTRDPAMLALFRDLEKAARSSLPILITGEPGTGKELFARAAHRLSGRAGQPFVAVNMAAIPPELFESELFGHVRGSFTGAVADRKGWFEQADRGTIFLDEVGDLRAEHQSKLLRVLQEKSFHRVGATRPTSVDVRVVAATNRDLARGVGEGWFREDLYFRLKGLVLRLPPLRERRGDIPLLAVLILPEAAAEVKRPGLTLSEAAMAALERHDWPGNVRELQNCLRQAAALADRDVLGPRDLRLTQVSPAAEPRDADSAVLAALRRHGFDMQATARALGWDRSTVTQHLKGLAFRALVDADGDAARAAAELAGDPALIRTVEVKLREYHEHLLRVVAPLDSVEAAVAACRRRFKNLPERHFRSLESLLRRRYGQPNG